jgi:N6-L-threonylcarbamoyladenine synthase
MTTLLGIETSCDETSAAVVRDGRDVLSNVVASQEEFHRKFRGVVPELAARAHIERLDTVIDEALAKATCSFERIDAVAVTNRPGLVGALLIGVTAAKVLSWVLSKPLVAVDHIQAHAYSPAIGLEREPWPAVALVASGGHTSLYHVAAPREVTLLGATIDDAAGEAFDKVAAILDLPYPGGPSVERLAREGDASAVAFPRTMLGEDSLDFSFSGVKTAVLYHVHGHARTSGGLEGRSRRELADIAASFQQSVIDVLVDKTMRAVQRTSVRTVVLGGGVAANRGLREALATRCAKRDLSFHAARPEYCTDNAAMIAALGYHLLARGEVADLDLDAHPTTRTLHVSGSAGRSAASGLGGVRDG